MVIELAATWLAQQLFVDVAQGIWDHLKDSVMGDPLSTALEQTIDEAIRLSIVEAGGDIDIDEEALDHVVAVFDQIWPTTDITETTPGLSLLDRFRQLTQVVMQICAEPVEGLGDSQPVSSLSIIADKHDLVLDPDSFAMLLADRWVGVITDRAVNNEVLKPVADQLNADRIFSGVSALHDKIDPDSPLRAKGLAPFYGRPVRVYGLFVTEPRQTQLDRLQELFTDASRGGRVTAVALHGAGGLGKTQIAARWWEDNQDSYDRRLWLDMRTDPDLVLARIATDLGLQGMDPVAEIVHYLSTTTERWLVVLDNAETAKAVEPYLPIEGTCDVVITSRYVDGWDTLNVAPIPVDVFDLESAVGLLSTVAGLDADDECAAVAERMGRVPLALTLAAHYIRESKWTFGSYFAYCDKHDFPLLNPADRAGYDRAIEAIWEESLATATERQADAEVVFRLISLLDWNDVDRAWFIQAAEYVIGVASLEAENTLATLHSYGLVDLTGDAVSIIHGLLAEGVTVATEENKVQLASFCNLVLDTEPEFRHVRELVMAHGRLVPREAVGILNRHAGHQLRSRLPDIRFHSELANISRRVLDFDHPTALVTRNNLASSYQAAGRTDEAVELREQALADCEHILGTDHADSLTSRNNLASSYQAAGRTDEAIRLKEQVLADRLRILGTEHPNTLASRNNLVLSYQAAGRIDEAIELGEQVLADSERILGTEHPNTLTSRNNLASPYQSAGRIDEAIELGERALADSERIHGTEHPNTLTSRNNLASLYQSAGRIEKAIELGEQALADRLRILGTEHPDTLTARNNLASSYQSAGRTDEAIRLKEEVLADSERILGTEHPNTLTSRNNLASSYEAAGRTDEAIELGEQVLADRERILGTEHPNTLASRHNLASSCQVAGRIDEAIALGERALADCERILGTDHPTTRASRNNLASSYESAGRIDEAIELKEQVLADRERILGTEHPTTAIARCHLAELRYRRNLNQ